MTTFPERKMVFGGSGAVVLLGVVGKDRVEGAVTGPDVGLPMGEPVVPPEVPPDVVPPDVVPPALVVPPVL